MKSSRHIDQMLGAGTAHSAWVGVILLMLLTGVKLAWAEVSFSVGWERPVQFKVVDAETGAVIPKPLLIIKTDKVVTGSSLPVAYYEVLEGSANGIAPYKASENVRGVEVRAVATGYVLHTQQVSWKELPPNKRDDFGLDIGPPPEITIVLKDLSRSNRWQSNFRLSIAPELDELLKVKPPFLSAEDNRILREFLNRERNRMIGL